MEVSSDSTETFSSKRLKVEEGQIDRISQLPESVLVDILSYLPTKDVVRMAVVPRFRDIWTFIHSLSFDQCGFHNYCFQHDISDGPHFDEKFLNLIRHVLILHDRSTINKFHLKFTFNLSNATQDGPYSSDYAIKENRMASEITTWIKFALKKEVKVLDIDLLGCGYSEPEAYYQLPNSVLTSNHLMELRLVGCEINAQAHFQMKSLKKLSLKKIILNDKVMEEILDGCPMLGELSLTKCGGLHRLKLNNPNVKRLNICLGWRYRMGITRVEIFCPHVVSLEIAGSIQLAHLRGSLSFFDASLYFSRSFKCKRNVCDSVQMLLWKLGRIHTFIPCTWTVLVFTIWELLKVPVAVTGWKRLEFRLLFSKWHLPGICSILKSSHRLETLTFYIYPSDNSSDSIFGNREAEWMYEHNFDAEDYFKSQNGVFLCLTKCLKTVMIYGYVTEPYVFELIEFILKKGLVLEKIVICTKKTLQPIHQYELFERAVKHQKNAFNPEELLEFSLKLLSVPRASRSAIIEFRC